jgi:flagellar hook protein FlgE
MGVWSAINNAVSGISAQAFALENISGNIANSSTTAYKRTDTSFSSLIGTSSSSSNTATSGSVRASSVLTAGIAGDISSSDISTYMALDSDDEFFEVSASTEDASTLYTRQGDFSLDADGYLVNGSGYYLQGYSIADDGSVSASLDLIDIDTDTMEAKVTSDISYAANLPTSPSTAAASEADDDTENPDLYTDGDGEYSTVTADEVDDFLDESVSGGSVAVYDAQGSASTLQLRWAKVGDDEWALYYQSDADAADDEAVWTQVSSGSDDGTVSGSFLFDSSGKLSTDVSSLSISGLSIDGSSIGDVSLDLSLTQYADSDGTVTTSSFSQDGYASGSYASMEIGSDGVVSYTYSNGQTKDVWKIPTVSFTNPSGLEALDGGAYSATVASGAAGPGSGTISSSALEGSNVDLSDEFTALIVTQQAYSANSKVITTANEMLEDILAIIR